MKSYNSILAGILILLFIPSACKNHGSKTNKPEVVAVSFIKHLSAFEFDKAKALGTQNTCNMIDILQSLYDLGIKQGTDMGQISKEVEVEVVRVAVDGDAAVVTYLDENGKEQTIDLIKEKGKWLVDLKKEMKPGEG